MCDVIICKEANDEDLAKFGCGTFSRSLSNLNSSKLELGVIETHTFLNSHIEEETSRRRLQPQDFQHLDHIGYTTLQEYNIYQEDLQGSSARTKKKLKFPKEH